MGRENFMLTLTNVKDQTPEYILVSNITRVNETKDGTAIHMMDGKAVMVSEKVVDIERQGASTGTLKVLKK